MILRIVSALLLVLLYGTASAQLVIDKKAIVKSGENLAVNIIKGQRYGRVLDFTEDIYDDYTAIEELQQQVLDDLKQAETVSDLHWADLSRSLYLATELIQGATQPGLEVGIVIDHPLLQRNPNDTYGDLFVAGAGDVLPNNLAAMQQAKQTSRSLTSSFYQLAAERKAYAAVAFQYLAEDLIVKATEMSEVLKQPERFSMTEAGRMRLQTFSEDYLLLASQMLGRSDQLLVDIAHVKPLRRKADQEQQRLERATIARTSVLDY